MLTITPEIEPIFAALLAEHPNTPHIMTRPRWSYAAALKAADEAIAERAAGIRDPKKATTAKRPAKRAAARKGAS